MQPKAAILELATIRNQFGGALRRRKLRLIGLIARQRFDNVRLLRDYHEVLLFLAVYPDSRRLHQQARNELQRVAGLVKAECLRSRKFEAAMADTGIEGTRTTRSFSYDLTVWLTQRFPRHVKICWDGDSASDALDDFLPWLATVAERDGLFVDRVTTRAWLGMASDARRGGELGWLLQQFDRLSCAPALRDRAFESLELFVDWVHRGPSASRTLIRFPRGPAFIHRDGLKHPTQPWTIVDEPLPAERSLPVSTATKLVDLCRAALAARGREIDTLTYANPREVIRFRLDRGIEVVIFGLLPERRLPVESYFGYVVAKNGVPIGYGGGWVFLRRCEIGVNLFDTFRGGESAFIFSQVLRVYRGLFDVSEFVVDPYQFGQENSEAIRSGAFWFYYRLGFRPTQPRLLALANEEAARIAQRQSYRSPAGTLRRLANSQMVMSLGRKAAGGGSHPDLGDVALAVTKRIKRRFHGDRGMAGSWALRRMLRALRLRSIGQWPAEERAAFESLSLLVAVFDELPRWTVADRRKLAELMRAKGGVSERRYVQLVQRHVLFAAESAELARSGSRIAAESTWT